MHQAPLVKLIVLEFDRAVVDRVEDVLGPGYKEPDNGAVFFGNSIKNDFRCGASEEDGTAAGDQGTEPVHLCACVVQRRDAEEGIILLLAVMALFHDRCVGDGAVFVKDRLGKSCCS